MTPDVSQTLPTNREFLDEALIRLRRLTRASKVVLFGLDSTQRKINVVAENGTGKLSEDALVDLIHSPVRDVVEDHELIRIGNARLMETRTRYLLPLLQFTSCFGVPVPGYLAEGYAVFIFHRQANAFDKAHEEYVQASALKLGALLERQQLQDRAAEIQGLMLIGQLSRGLVHEINHQLGFTNLALGNLDEQLARIERLSSDSPELVEEELPQVRETLNHLAQSIRSLTGTTKLFGRFTIQRQEELLLLDDVIQEVVELVLDMANLAHVTIEVQPPPKLLFTRVQATRVQQIMVNIVLNAVQQIALVRPREGGRVRIRMGQKHRDQKIMLQVSVEDDGPGVHRRLWGRIFDLAVTTRDEEGSGLGLYITRSLAEALGGHVYVDESHILWGTKFVVELPFKL